MIATKPRLAKVGTPTSTRFGYIVAIIVNAAMLFIANHLLDWGWPAFITDDFGEVLWLIDISFLATIAVNSIYMAYDPAWFKSICQIGLGAISMAVAIRMYQVFPFDFTGYEFDWVSLTRFVLVLTMVGTGIAILQAVVQLGREAATTSKQVPQAPQLHEWKR
jgi:hypothetical protein